MLAMSDYQVLVEYEQLAWQRVKQAELELALANEAWEHACTAKRLWEEQHEHRTTSTES